MDKLSFEQKAEILKKVSLFEGLHSSKDGIHLLAGLMHEKAYHAGDLLTEQGKSGDEFYVLIRGTASVYKKTPEGDPYKVAVLDEKFHPAFGEGGLIDGEARSATIICDKDVRCLILTKTQFIDICNQHPEVALPILKKAAQALMARLHQTTNDLMLLHKALMNEIRSS